MTLFPTSLVGSYPQPDWLIDRAKLAGRFPPRVRARELWRPAPEYLAQAQDDATLLAIRAQEEAGLDILTDGEIRRESYSNHFATALDGVDIDNPGEALDRSGHPNPVPRVVGADPPARPDPAAGPGVPAGAHRPDRQDHRARAVHDVAAGAGRLLRRPAVGRAGVRRGGQRRRSRTCSRPAPTSSSWTSRTCRPGRSRPASTGWRRSTGRWTGSTGTTAVHICFGYAAIIHERPSGYSFLPELADCPCDQISIETAQSNLDTVGAQAPAGQDDHPRRARPVRRRRSRPRETVAERVRRALPYVDAERVVLAPDCGMKYLPRESADGKMRAMAAAARDPQGRLGHPVQLDAEVLAVRGEHLGVRAERRLGPLGPDRPDQRPAGDRHLAVRGLQRGHRAGAGSARTARSAATSRSARSRPAARPRAPPGTAARRPAARPGRRRRRRPAGTCRPGRPGRRARTAAAGGCCAGRSRRRPATARPGRPAAPGGRTAGRARTAPYTAGATAASPRRRAPAAAPRTRR